MPNVDIDGVQVNAELRDGKEYGDPVPMAPPVGMSRPLTLAEQIRSMVRRELSDAAHSQGFETFEEADDFDIDDDPLDPHTPYEAVFDPPPPVGENENGSSSLGESGSSDVVAGSGQYGKKSKAKSESKPDSSDSGSVSKGGESSSDAQG